MPGDRSTERNKKKEGQHSRENKRKMAWEDVAIPVDRNVVQKEAEKKLKYKSLCIEIKRMWNLKCTIVKVKVKQSRYRPRQAQRVSGT